MYSNNKDFILVSSSFERNVVKFIIPDSSHEVLMFVLVVYVFKVGGTLHSLHFSLKELAGKASNVYAK